MIARLHLKSKCNLAFFVLRKTYILKQDIVTVYNFDNDFGIIVSREQEKLGMVNY